MSRPRFTKAEALSRLRHHLADTGYGPREKLEPERSLCDRLGCSRDPLRAALDALETEGRLWRHVGQGTFTGPRPFHEPISPMVLAESATPADIIDARLLLEPGIAAAAATRAGSEDLARLRNCAAAMLQATDWRMYELADNAFHKGIARATGNPLVIAFLDVISAVRARATWQREHALTFRREREREYTERQGCMHMTILYAIEARAPEGSHLAMGRHLRAVRDVMVGNA